MNLEADVYAFLESGKVQILGVNRSNDHSV